MNRRTRLHEKLLVYLGERLASVATPPPEQAESVIEAHLASDDPDRWLSIATVAAAQAIAVLEARDASYGRDEEDLEWAFNVMMLHASVIRRPADIPAWRKAMRDLARSRGVKISTGVGHEGTAWAAAPNVSEQIGKEIREDHGPNLMVDQVAAAERRELYGPGGWNWDQRAKPQS